MKDVRMYLPHVSAFVMNLTIIEIWFICAQTQVISFSPRHDARIVEWCMGASQILLNIIKIIVRYLSS